MLTLNCIIIEDEVPASEVLKDYVKNIPSLRLIAVFEDVMSALGALQSEKIDIIFLDINLPVINGMDFLKSLKGNYKIIITTAYHNYAIQGFDLGVCDYLLKPVSFERFLKAVNKASSEGAITQSGIMEEKPLDYFFVKADNKYEKINLNSILYIEALQNYITIHCDTKKVITYSSLKSIESYLPEKEFLRVQKSFIVAISKIDFIESDDLVIGKTVIPISRSIKENVLNSILNNRLFRHKGG